ncbi:MAG TPA: DUF349 domain-containing protein [Bacteroidales bacterium]|nr:DUF349 domain-containing protein [Bacteroidales bacterium]
MKSTEHPDQNPEEVIVTSTEENLNEVTSEIDDTTTKEVENAGSEPVSEDTAASIAVVDAVNAVEEQPAESTELAEAVAEPVEASPAPVAEEVANQPDEQVEKAADTEAGNVAETTEEAGNPVAEAQTETVVNETENENAEAETSVSEVILPEISEEEEEEAAAEVELEENTADIKTYSREKLVSMLETVVHEEDINAIKATVALIKVAYLARTKEEYHEMYQKASAEEEPENIVISDPVDERFKAAFNIYKENKARYTELQEQEKIRNLEAKKLIIKELKDLIDSEETLKKTYDDFKALQERWKGIGMVPKGDANELWQNYHFLIERFFDKVKINKELKDLDLRKNMERKIDLCEKAEELFLETSMAKAFKKLQELHDEWKEIGPVPQDKREEVWDRFKTASDKINERRREFYGKVQEEQDANYAAKVVLCDQLEQLCVKEYAAIKDWQNSTNQVNELLKVWKTIGQAPKKTNQEIWNRFKGYLDTYFSGKKEFFDRLKEQQLHNYNLKVDLCAQAESHKLSTDWKNSSRELIRLQEEWKKIGPVPRKHSDKIWKRFRAACDEFFSNKSEYFKNVQQTEEENMKVKEEIIAKLSGFEFTDDRQANLATMKELQRQWMETGHVPLKEKNRLQDEYKAALNKLYDTLKVNALEASTMNYKSRFENIREQPDASRIINRERMSLQTRIDEMKEEILLWENNIGFFANSKQANVLKAEFEAKISHAKDELAKLEAKMKFLNKTAREQQQNQ